MIFQKNTSASGLISADEFFYISPIFFGGAPAAFVAEDFCIGPLFADFFVFGFRGLVFEVLGHERRTDAVLGEGEDVQCASECFGASDDGVADAHFGGGLGDGAVEPHRRAAAGLGRIAACFINTDGPEPAIYSDRLHGDLNEDGGGMVVELDRYETLVDSGAIFDR